MRPALPATVLLCVLLLPAPVGAAPGAVDLEGRFPLEFSGRGSVHASGAAALVQGDAGLVRMALDGLEAGALHVLYHGTGATHGTPDGLLVMQEEAEQDALDLGGATLRLLSRAPTFRMLLFDADARLANGSASPIVVHALQAPVEVATGFPVRALVALGQGTNASAMFARTLEAGRYDARLTDGTLAADGPFGLYLAGCDLAYQAPGQPVRTLRLREQVREVPGNVYEPVTGTWAGPGTHTEFAQEFLVVHATRARLEASVAGTPLSLTGPGLALDGTGTLKVPQARGTLFVRDGDSATTFSPFSPGGQDLALDGTFALDLRKRPDDLNATTLSGSGDLAAIRYGTVATRFPATLATAAGVGALLAVAAAWLAWKGQLAGLVAGYARVHGERLLRHPNRAAIYACVQAHPGIALPQVATRCGVSVSTARHHLRALETAGFVLATRDGRALRLFDGRSPLYQGPRRRLLTVLRNANTRAIAQHVRTHPGVAQQDLVARFGLSQSTVKWHLNRLVAAELVEARRDPPFVRYFAAAAWAHLPEPEPARDPAPAACP
ncbi:MAG: winged helix-turn-helix transcriptional regulator [Thermoplasmatota archaeon]